MGRILCCQAWYKLLRGADRSAGQALRQSLLKKYARIRYDMDKLHNSRMSPYEKIEALESIRCQIQGAWRTDEIRRQKPTPQVPHPSCPLAKHGG